MNEYKLLITLEIKYKRKKKVAKRIVMFLMLLQNKTINDDNSLFLMRK